MSHPVHALEERIAALPRGLREHVLRVRELAEVLARRFSVDPASVDAAVLVHDLARAQSPASMLAYVRELGWRVDPLEQSFPIFLHGRLGAEEAYALGVRDAVVLEAAACHITGRPGMTDVDMVLFLADKLEPGKARRFRGLAKARDLAEQDLRRAVLEALTWLIRYHAGRGSVIHPDSVAARNELVLSQKVQG